MIKILYYIPTLFFIWSYVHIIRHKERLYKKNKSISDIEEKSTSDKIYYFSKPLYFSYLIYGSLFSDYKFIFSIICFVIVSKFLIFNIRNKNFVIIYDFLYPFLIIILLGIIFIKSVTSIFFQL